MMALELEVAGEMLMLLPQKAMYWPSNSTLIIADIHFGKAATFRRLGVPVPHGTTAQNLELLDELMMLYPTQHIIFLGDFLHAPDISAATLQSLLNWRTSHPALEMTLVRGNHDLRAGDPPQELGIHIVNEPFRSGPYAFCHYPDIESDGYVLAGHVHPSFHLYGKRDSLRLPCFVVGERRTILPAFGAFTGTYTMSPQVGEQIFIIADDRVMKIGN
ncbi:ligase-associated DNA damage response endonuclease PdeM [Undibacterium sp. TC4M20W]|uniref:ligase-associated DNA damage response endonuclease PdeM n=1 Tax=Undibacterium sp. TC4M20W TaxID=3413052 RepID=UPI003BF17C35